MNSLFKSTISRELRMTTLYDDKEIFWKECFRSNMKLIRNRLGLSQKEFAEHLSRHSQSYNFHQTEISNYEKTGSLPQLSKLIFIKDTFGMYFDSIEDIYTRKLDISLTKTKDEK